MDSLLAPSLKLKSQVKRATCSQCHWIKEIHSAFFLRQGPKPPAVKSGSGPWPRPGGRFGEVWTLQRPLAVKWLAGRVAFRSWKEPTWRSEEKFVSFFFCFFPSFSGFRNVLQGHSSSLCQANDMKASRSSSHGKLMLRSWLDFLALPNWTKNLRKRENQKKHHFPWINPVFSAFFLFFFFCVWTVWLLFVSKKLSYQKQAAWEHVWMPWPVDDLGASWGL